MFAREEHDSPARIIIDGSLWRDPLQRHTEEVREVWGLGVGRSGPFFSLSDAIRGWDGTRVTVACCSVRSGKQTCGRMLGYRDFVEKGIVRLRARASSMRGHLTFTPTFSRLQTGSEICIDVGARVGRGNLPITSTRPSALTRHFSSRPTISSSSSAHATPIPPAARTSHRAFPSSPTFYSVRNGGGTPTRGSAKTSV